MTAPTVVRMSDEGPWRRYKVTDGSLDRYVIISVQSYSHPKPHDNIAHFSACGTSLHQWTHYFEAYRAYRDIPAGFTLTDAGRELLAAADEAYRVAQEPEPEDDHSDALDYPSSYPEWEAPEEEP